MAPTVQSLSDIMLQLDPAYQGQRQILDKQSGQVDTETQNTITGLKAQRGEAWNDIGRSANARGFAFGGIRADEQARYDSTQFMPAVANTETAGINAKNNLALKAAELSTDATKTGIDIQQTQQGALNQWNMQQAQLEASRRENELNRQFEAGQNALNRSASAAASAPAAPTQDQWLMASFESLANAGSSQGTNWLKNYSTENASIVGRLASQFGLSHEEARQYVYSKRRDWYGS